MITTLQSLINDWRLLIGEPDATNSRWVDATHGKFYVNEGRREFSKASKAVKSEFRRITSIGATSPQGSGEEARYDLDPLVIKIDRVEWNGHHLQEKNLNWDDDTGRGYFVRQDSLLQGIPCYFRRVGNSIDLYPAPSEEKTLIIIASTISADLELLSSEDNELKDDQNQVAIRYAAFKALTDDGRDGSIYIQQFADGVKFYNNVYNPRTSIGVKQTYDYE